MNNEKENQAMFFGLVSEKASKIEIDENKISLTFEDGSMSAQDLIDMMSQSTE